MSRIPDIDRLTDEQLAEAAKARQAEAATLQRLASAVQRDADRMRKEIKRRKSHNGSQSK